MLGGNKLPMLRPMYSEHVLPLKGNYCALLARWLASRFVSALPHVRSEVLNEGCYMRNNGVKSHMMCHLPSSCYPTFHCYTCTHVHVPMITRALTHTNVAAQHIPHYSTVKCCLHLIFIACMGLQVSHQVRSHVYKKIMLMLQLPKEYVPLIMSEGTATVSVSLTTLHVKENPSLGLPLIHQTLWASHKIGCTIVGSMPLCSALVRHVLT